MNRQEAQGALSVVGTVAALGLFLPGIDRVWAEAPHEDLCRRTRQGETLYLGTAAALTILASYANGSPAPFIVGMGLALLIVGYQEYSLRHRKPAAPQGA